MCAQIFVQRMNQPEEEITVLLVEHQEAPEEV